MTSPRLRILSVALLGVLALPLLTGCWGSSTKKEPFHLGNLIEDKDFTPPTLEELNAKVEWVDNDLVDAIEHLRERQAGEPILATVEEALELENTSSENNDRILSALGRLPETESDVARGSTIARHTTGDIKSSNPLFASSTAEQDVSSLTGIGLVGFDWDFKTYGSPDTIVSWQTSADGLYDKFVLRDDLFWSDGTPVTAHDFVFTYKVVMSKQVPVISRTAEQELKWVEAYDDRTLVIFHKQSLATNRWNCSLSVIPKHIYEDSIDDDPTLATSTYHVEQELNPVVAGAYEIEKRTRGKEVILQAREEYYMQGGTQVRDRPYFDRVHLYIIDDPNTALLALKKGQIEEMRLQPEQWDSLTTGQDFYNLNTKSYATEWTTFHFCWNVNTPFFSDSRVRWAMTYAFDHQEMLSTIFLDLYEPSSGVFHPDSRWSPNDPPSPVQRNVARAKELLEQAGWVDHDGDGILDKEINGRSVPFEFTIICKKDPNREAVCELLQRNLQEIGVICTVRAMEFTVLQEKTQEHAFQATMGGWGTGADPFTLQNIFGSGEDRNFGEYENPEVDRLFREGLVELDEDKREAIYEELHMVLWNDQAYTWLFNPSGFHGFNKDLRGYVFSPRGPFGYGPGFSSLWKPAEQ